MFKRKQKFYESIYKKAFKSFFGLCMRYTKNREDAEEVFNDGMTKFFKYIDKNQVEEKTQFGLIKKIMITTSIDLIRRRKMKFVDIDQTSTNEFKTGEEVSGHFLNEELLLLVQKLPAQTRLVFNLFIFEGWSHKEISDTLEITENTSY